MQRQPLFLLGAPRSGTTFLCALLNQHPEIQLTSECRVFVLLKHFLEVQGQRADLLDASLRDEFLAFVRRNAGDWIERFYRDHLGIGAPIWGDKHPSYADPAVLSGRCGSSVRAPLSGSCLRLIRDCLPDAKFIHIHRDPIQVGHSMARKHWVPSVEDGVRVWQQYVSEIIAFFGEIEPDRRFSIPYRALIEDAETTANRVVHFLGLVDSGPIRRFLAEQRHHATPFSEPVRNLADLYVVPPSEPVETPLLRLAGAAGVQLGYTSFQTPDDTPRARTVNA